MNDRQLIYLMSMTRMDIRKQERRIVRFKTLHDQADEGAALALGQFTRKLIFMEETYRALGGDPARITVLEDEPVIEEEGGESV